MNAELQQRLNEIPEDSPRSRLEPFSQFILRWRRQGRSYERIRQILRDECRVNVAHATLFKFVQRRSRPRKVQTEPELEQPTIPSAARSSSQRATTPSSDDLYAEARERMRRHKAEPVQPKKSKVFEINEEDFEKPLQMMAKPKT